MYLLNKIDRFKKRFIREYGERKYKKIYSRIYSSNKIMDLIIKSQDKQLVPLRNDYIYSLKETPYFFFSKADTLAMGAVLALEFWNITSNKNYCFLGEHELIRVFDGILWECNSIKIQSGNNILVSDQ